MTIKQQGGIFGRNPTFNNIEVDGTMSVNGLTTFNDNVTISKTTGTSLALLDSDGGFAAATLTVENGGRDLAIFAPQDIIFDQDGLETARFLSGGGLTFNGDTAAANALDDYEEGTATFGSGNLSYTGTFVGTGFYTKVGNLVTVIGTLSAATLSGVAGSFFTGLPFTPTSISAGSLALRNRNGGCFAQAFTNGNVYVTGFSGYPEVQFTITYKV